MTQTSRPSNCSCPPPPIWTRGASEGQGILEGQVQVGGKGRRKEEEICPQSPPCHRFGAPGRDGPSSLGSAFADIEGILGCTPEDLHQLVFPGEGIAQQRPRAVGDTLDLGRRQDVVPQVKLGNVTHEGLSGIKPAAQSILGQENSREKTV